MAVSLGLKYLSLNYGTEIISCVRFVITYGFDSYNAFKNRNKGPLIEDKKEHDTALEVTNNFKIEHPYQFCEGTIGKSAADLSVSFVGSFAYYLTKLLQAGPKGVTTATLENLQEVAEKVIDSGESVAEKIIKKKR